MNGWAQVDSICQNVFQLDEMLIKWKKWEKVLVKLNKSENIHKRRASFCLFVNLKNQTPYLLVHLTLSRLDQGYLVEFLLVYQT